MGISVKALDGLGMGRPRVVLHPLLGHTSFFLTLLEHPTLNSAIAPGAQASLLALVLIPASLRGRVDSDKRLCWVPTKKAWEPLRSTRICVRWTGAGIWS